MKRYKFVTGIGHYMIPSPKGEWVRWEDVEKLQAELQDINYDYNKKTNNLIERHVGQIRELQADIKVLSEELLSGHINETTFGDDLTVTHPCTCQACEVARRYTNEKRELESWCRALDSRTNSLNAKIDRMQADINKFKSDWIDAFIQLRQQVNEKPVRKAKK